MEAISALQAICTGNSPVSGEFPAQRLVTRSVDVFFDLRLNKRLSKQWYGEVWDAIAPIMTSQWWMSLISSGHLSLASNIFYEGQEMIYILYDIYVCKLHKDVQYWYVFI